MPILSQLSKFLAKHSAIETKHGAIQLRVTGRLFRRARQQVRADLHDTSLSNAATIVAEIDRNSVFCDKFLLSRGRRRSFLASKWRTKLLLTDSHEVVSRKLLNGLERKTSR